MTRQHASNRSLLAEKLVERLSDQVRGRPLAEARTLIDLREITPDALPILASKTVSETLATTKPRQTLRAEPGRARAQLDADGEAFVRFADRLVGLGNQIDSLQRLREALCLRAILDSLLVGSRTDQQLLTVSFQGGSGAVSTFEMARGERLLSIMAALSGDRPLTAGQPSLQVFVGAPGLDFEVPTNGPVAPQILSCSFSGEGWGGSGAGHAQIRIRLQGTDISPFDAGNQLALIKDRLEHPELLLLI